jgi:hypothetical protein
MPTPHTTTRPQRSNPTQSNAGNKPSKRKARKGHLVESECKHSPFQDQDDFSDEDTPPPLSQALKMPQFKKLEIVDLEESLQEVIQEGDW